MTIKRTINGIEYEFTLSGAELRGAYEEQQHLYDIMDVKQELEDQGLEDMATETEIENMANDMRDIIFDTGCAWRDAAERAVGEWYNKKEV